MSKRSVTKADHNHIGVMDYALKTKGEIFNLFGHTWREVEANQIIPEGVLCLPWDNTKNQHPIIDKFEPLNAIINKGVPLWQQNGRTKWQHLAIIVPTPIGEIFHSHYESWQEIEHTLLPPGYDILQKDIKSGKWSHSKVNYNSVFWHSTAILASTYYIESDEIELVNLPDGEWYTLKNDGGIKWSECSFNDVYVLHNGRYFEFYSKITGEAVPPISYNSLQRIPKPKIYRKIKKQEIDNTTKPITWSKAWELDLWIKINSGHICKASSFTELPEDTLDDKFLVSRSFQGPWYLSNIIPPLKEK